MKYRMEPLPEGQHQLVRGEAEIIPVGPSWSIEWALAAVEFWQELERLQAQRDELREALLIGKSVALEAHDAWDADRDARVGKLLRALAGEVRGFRADIDSIHVAIARVEAGTGGENVRHL